ncbi:bacterial exopeptidase dimerization domain-containing protein, partial [Backusella circina FSU 941]
HPYPVDELYGPMLALDSCHIDFFGKASHAGQAPWKGINALDAVMQAFDNVAMLRQQTLPTNRLHGIITKGGDSPNVIPAHASCYFYVRSITKNQLKELKVKFINCFIAAAKATQCQYTIKWNESGPIDDVFMNDTMTLLFKKYQMEQGIKFESRSTEVSEYASGSTDMGNFSYVVPSIHPHFGIHTNAANHTTGFEKAARTEIAHLDTIKAARSLSFTAAEVLVDDGVYQAVVEDFKKGKPQ